jgi:hypothetical protein
MYATASISKVAYLIGRKGKRPSALLALFPRVAADDAA